MNDGWTDLAHNFQMDWTYDSALDGNIALTAEIDLSRGTEFTLGIGFGHTQHSASTTVYQSLSIPFDVKLRNFNEQWERTSKRFALLDRVAEHDSTLFERSVNLLLAHEDKLYPGAMIASLSIPWGEDKGDDDLGGYHLVWTRDMVNGATALLAVGDTATPLRALVYLAICAARGRRLLPELLDRRAALLVGHAIGRGLVPHHAGVAHVEGGRPA